MKTDPNDALERWLAAEREDDAEAAEAALASLFTALPAAAPPLGFAARTTAVALAPTAAIPARPRGALATLWGRLVLALTLTSAGLAAPFAPAFLRWLAGGFDAAAAVAAVPRLIAAACGQLVRLVDALVRLADLAGAIKAPFEAPAVAAALLGSLLVAAAAFRLLHHLIAHDRSWSYVDAHD